MYSCDRKLKPEVLIVPNTHNIQVIYDQTLSGYNATQTTPSLRPGISSAKNAKRYYFHFDGTKRMISDIDLNAPTGTIDIVHVFVFTTFILTTEVIHISEMVCSDMTTEDEIRFLVFDPTNSNALRISGVFAADTVDVTSSDWQTKVDASAVAKWICLSVHWDVPKGTNKSSCWVNGKKVKTFEAASSG